MYYFRDAMAEPAKTPVEVVRPHEQPQPEAEALASLERGDRRAALTVLMRTYGAALYRFCLEMVGDRALASDVHQMVFIQAFEDLSTFSRRSTLRAWLYGIARHRCLDVAKGNRRWLRVVRAEETLPDAADPAPGPDERVSGKRIGAAIDDCLSAMPPHSREVLVLRYREGFSYDVIASMVGERAGTLRVRLLRALPQLKSCLEGRGIEL